MSGVRILTDEPTIAVIAEMAINWTQANEILYWLRERRPDAVKDCEVAEDLFPHEIYTHPGATRDNELLAELAGRKCYDSFAAAAGRKTNAAYLAHALGSGHASIAYHAKMSFFFAGISRRMSHELIRNYVGSDRDEEGSPSQESTRFTHHYGSFVLPPRYLHAQRQAAVFEARMVDAYGAYTRTIEEDVIIFRAEHGTEPKGMDRKRIYEAAAALLPGAAETSFIWTTNPMALSKMFRERCDEHADLEFQRFAKKLRGICVARWPNLFQEVAT